MLLATVAAFALIGTAGCTPADDGIGPGSGPWQSASPEGKPCAGKLPFVSKQLDRRDFHIFHSNFNHGAHPRPLQKKLAFLHESSQDE